MSPITPHVPGMPPPPEFPSMGYYLSRHRQLTGSSRSEFWSISSLMVDANETLIRRPHITLFDHDWDSADGGVSTVRYGRAVSELRGFIRLLELIIDPFKFPNSPVYAFLGVAMDECGLIGLNNTPSTIRPETAMQPNMFFRFKNDLFGLMMGRIRLLRELDRCGFFPTHDPDVFATVFGRFDERFIFEAFEPVQNAINIAWWGWKMFYRREYTNGPTDLSVSVSRNLPFICRSSHELRALLEAEAQKQGMGLETEETLQNKLTYHMATTSIVPLTNDTLAYQRRYF